MTDHSPHMQRIATLTLAFGLALSASGCAQRAPQVLGTLEWDRITLPAPVSERIAAVNVHEGQTVVAGDTVMVLEPERTRARLEAAQADTLRLQHALDELKVGPRREDIDAARARLSGAQSVATNAKHALDRARAEFARQVIARASLDAAIATSGSADADVEAAKQALEALTHGSRPEDIAQAEAAMASSKAQAAALAVDLERTRIVAPRAGRIDSLPYKAGDQPPIGAPLAIVLVGDAPYARVYVPEPQRAHVSVGQVARVFASGHTNAYVGKVRTIRSEPTFTPYYALSGDDAARLSYLAEIELGKDAADLPVGVPVHAEFETGAAR
jgi:HlyD family secretion protein